MNSELVKVREKEIMDACIKLYETKNLNEISIKDISKETSISRPSIYNYFQTKEEIFLAILISEYDKWIEELETIQEDLPTLLAITLSHRELLLKITANNLYEIEEHSRVERLVEFKKRFMYVIEFITNKLNNKDSFKKVFIPMLYGIYSYVYPSNKQNEAINMIGINKEELSIYDVVYNMVNIYIERNE